MTRRVHWTVYSVSNDVNFSKCKPEKSSIASTTCWRLFENAVALRQSIVLWKLRIEKKPSVQKTSSRESKWSFGKSYFNNPQQAIVLYSRITCLKIIAKRTEIWICFFFFVPTCDPKQKKNKRNNLSYVMFVENNWFQTYTTLRSINIGTFEIELISVSNIHTDL